MSAAQPRRWRRKRAARPAPLALASVVAVLVAGTALASHAEVSLPGSNFEIDTDANLKLDDAAPSIDWASVTEIRKADSASGSGDESFGQGAKEDTPVPTVVDGGIPPNKSDLKFFGVYQEGTGGSGFLNLYWSRVQDPTGTTNMDFEFNKRQCTPGTPVDPDCTANGLTPIRSAGDLLIQYDLTNGGTDPELFLSRWLTTGGGSLCEAANSTPCWSDRVNLSDAGDATGSINTSAIPLDESDGLGAHSARTFGEAQLDLSAIFDPTVCDSFGSAYLKSRSSDSFTAAMKDFVPPAAVNIANCGGLSVKKYIDVDEDGEDDDSGATATDLAGWTISVTKDGGGFSCSGTTDATGALSGCAGLSTLVAGTYTVTETAANATRTIGTNAALTFNTDPGADGVDGASQNPAAATAPPVSESVTIGVSENRTVDFGNSCYATAGFSVTGVPAGTTGLFVRYAVNGGATQDVNLTGTTSTRTASVGSLRRGDDITWEVRSTQVNGVIAGTAFELAGYPACAGSGSAAFQTATVTGFKYKDLDADGTRDAGENGIGGFEFTMAGQTATSAPSGTITFNGIAPGTYTMDEVGPPGGWQQTEPAGNGTVSVTVPLGATGVQADPFGNTPLSRIDIEFTSKAKLPGTTTDATHATTITCESGGQSVVTSGSGNSRTADDLLLTKSPVTCVVTYEDP